MPQSHLARRHRHTSRRSMFALAGVPLGALFASGCVTYFALDTYLDAAVGRPPGESPYPRLQYQRIRGESESVRIVEYAIDSLWRCRWIFEIDKTTGNVERWSYPDEDA